MIKVFEAPREDYRGLIGFFVDHGLEFDGNEELTDDILGIWKATDGEDLAGAIVLAKREGKFIIDGLAVEPRYRGENLGGKLYKLAEEKAAEMGGTMVYLVARIPKFWANTGFSSIEKEEKAPNFFECETCDQYMKTCFPEVMKKTI